MTVRGGRAAKWRTALLFLSISMASYAVKAQVNGDLRLSGYGASKLAGRLEIFHDGKWGTVCAQDMYNFDFIATSVACRQLGLGFATDWYGVYAPSGLRYGVGGGEVGLEDVVCEGGERHLLRCRHSSVWGVNATCKHQYDIAIACSNVTTPYSGEIRLVGGSFSSVGMVELYVRRQWAPLCSVGFGLQQANAVCRQLGYTEAAHFFRNVSFEGPFWQLGAYGECGASSPCFTDCLQELPVTMTNSCPGNSGVEVKCMYSTERAANFTSGNETLCARNSTSLEEGTVRLSNEVATTDTIEGIVEVHFNGMWGTLCNEHFTWREADVVCKGLGFPAALTYGHFGEGNGSIYHVSCTGLEHNLNDCTYSSPASNHCSHSDDIGVRCSNVASPYGTLTLRGGVGAAGTLLVYSYSSTQNFEPICDARFGMAEAQVACRQLGYSSATAVLKNSYFGPTANASHLFSHSPSCSGSESHLLKCTLHSGVQGCRGGMDEVGIQCSTSDPPLLRLRLVGGSGPNAGRLEVDLGGGEWGTVCGGGERFGYLSAYVVCRQLNYATAVRPAVFLNRYGSGVGPIHLSSVSCVGFERSLFDCPLTLGDGEGTCSHGMDVGIECSNSGLPWREGTLRLVNDSSANTTTSSTQTSGRLEIFLHGVWMTVCGEMFTDQAANVACRQLGFDRAVEHCTNACFGVGRDFIYYAENNCTGRESSLLDCTTEKHNPSLCHHSMDIGVVCDGTSSPPPPLPHPSTPPPMAESSRPHISTITSAHFTSSTPSPPSPPPTSKEPPSPLVPIPQLYFYIGLAVAALIILALIVAVTVYCICRLRKKHVSTVQTGTAATLDNYDDPTHTVELTALSKSAEAEAYKSPPLEPPPNYDELDFVSSKPNDSVTE